VEEELGSSETRVERVGDETFGEGVDGTFREMRKRTILETIGDTVTGDNLLTDTSNHLRDVNLRT